MTPNPCKIGSPEWLAEIRAQYRTDEEIDSWYQPKEPDGYARRVVSDLVRMIDALAAERDAEFDRAENAERAERVARSNEAAARRTR